MPACTEGAGKAVVDALVGAQGLGGSVEHMVRQVVSGVQMA